MTLCSCHCHHQYHHHITGIIVKLTQNHHPGGTSGKELTSLSEWRNISFISGCDLFTVTDSSPYLETFPAVPECWKLATNPWHAWTWTNGKLYHNHMYPGTDTCGIMSPVFDISVVTHPYVSVKHSSNNGSNNADDFGVYYRTSATDSWHKRGLFTQSSSSLQNDSIPLPAGSDYIQLAFFVFYRTQYYPSPAEGKGGTKAALSGRIKLR